METLLRSGTIVAVGDETLSNVRRVAAQPPNTSLVLGLVIQASDPTAPPACYRLDEIDSVVFGRGPRSVSRDEANGLREPADAAFA